MKKPVVAICYDFDKTLSPDNMQAQGYLQAIKYECQDEFWKETNELARANRMDSNLAWMYLMLKGARGKEIFRREMLARYGAQVKLYDGVEEWFDRICRYGEERGVTVEHYIVSSGLREMIEGTCIADKFTKIYASSFYYDADGVAVWPAQVVNYTSKTQFLFRISKGVLDVNDPAVNDYFAPDEIRVPFTNMVYIGDSETDIPCMKLVNTNGGHSIGVYNNDTLDKSKVYKMLHDNRIRYFAPADYTDGSKLDLLVKAIIDRTAANEVLENVYYDCKDERDQNDTRRSNNEEKRNRLDLILSLDGSASFGTTHTLIKEMLLIDSWTSDEIEMLLDIALNRHPVRYLLNDLDVKSFYQKIIRKLPKDNTKAAEIEKFWEQAENNKS